MMTPINIDGVTSSPDEMEHISNVLRLYSDYARSKSVAMRGREWGKVSDALGHEEWCEEIYERLPEWAQWKV